MMKEIKTLSKEEFANYTRSVYETIMDVVTPLNLIHEDLSDGESHIVVQLSSPLINTCEVASGYADFRTPLYITGHFLEKSTLLTMPPFESNYYQGLMEGFDEPQSEAFKDFVADLFDGLEKRDNQNTRVMAEDLEEDGSMTPSAAANLKKETQKQISNQIKHRESNIKKSRTYKIAKAVVGLKLGNGYREPKNMDAQDKKIMSLFTSGKMSYILQAIEFCASLNKTDLLSYVLRRHFSLNPVALTRLGKM
jgi:hypothetical protein